MKQIKNEKKFLHCVSKLNNKVIGIGCFIIAYLGVANEEFEK
jgi:hypothetical protein